MRLKKIGRKAGANEYEVYTDNNAPAGWLHREYAPWHTQFGKQSSYDWRFTEYPDYSCWHIFESFKKAKDYLMREI